MNVLAKFLIVPAALSLLLEARLQAHDDSVLTNGLVAYYPFNGDVSDTSGNGLHGAPELCKE